MSLGAERPFTLVAELTYKCPLACLYCSNPHDFAGHKDRLTTDRWLRVFKEAEELGVVQLHLTGGEPLLRQDLESLIAGARELDLYINLITSGAPVTRERLTKLVEAGLDNLQLSFQSLESTTARTIAGRESLEQKLQVADWARELGVPLTINMVLVRQNIDQVSEIVAFAEQAGAERLELANAQYLGFALQNRDALLPSRDQIEKARGIARDAKQRNKGRIEILFVLPDYYSEFPRACMDGWARRYIVVTPDGFVLPCHQAHTIRTLQFETIFERPLTKIWQNSPALAAFRGQSWMTEPCRSCDRRNIDFGGCRCQAYHLANSAAATDPACSLAPTHDLVVQARALAESGQTPDTLHYRGALRVVRR
jgi:pyrroloquinoline quinone biosynthesis protein E